MTDLIERLRNFENSDELGSGDFSLLHEAADALEAAWEDARTWRYWANGPQGNFLTDNLELATAILAAYDKDGDWTVADIADPTGAAIDRARGEGGGFVGVD